MKIIFLDIDGVLNSNEWASRRFEETSMDSIASSYPFYEFDPLLVKNLNKIIDKTGAKVVVSSTWRLGRTKEELQEILNGVGFTGEVIDVTPYMPSPLGFGYDVPRGCEIDWWLEQNGGFHRINWSLEEFTRYVEKAKIKNYVILDDDSDMLYNQREHFVLTSFMDGLSESCVDKAISILNTPVQKLYYPNYVSNS